MNRKWFEQDELKVKTLPLLARLFGKKILSVDSACMVEGVYWRGVFYVTGVRDMEYQEPKVERLLRMFGEDSSE